MEEFQEENSVFETHEDKMQFGRNICETIMMRLWHENGFNREEINELLIYSLESNNEAIKMLALFERIERKKRNAKDGNSSDI
ncbi:MAG: hypothetical protein HW380_3697 [Magnetococcales bacterium]|nr:hypothetical protein [Magnetococcales bacterium]